MSKYVYIAISTVILTAVVATRADVQVSGLVDLVAKNSGQEDITNVTFPGTSNLHTTRARLFFDAPLEGQNAAFMQLLWDNGNMMLYAAYLRFVRPFNLPVNVNAGLIPNTVGNFGPRTYSDTNPLIGTPLLWNHHSSYVPNEGPQSHTVDELLARKSLRSNHGLPLLYDNCWNSGVEIFGPLSRSLTYSVGFLAGSVAKRTIEQKKDIPQVTTRLGIQLGPDVALGLNGFVGPYLWEELYNDTLPAGADFEDYLNYGAGCDVAYSRGYLEMTSELFFGVWEVPYLPDLKLTAGYIEGKYKFMPGWYAAARFGFYEPGKLSDSGGARVHWDYPVKRYEFGIGFHPGRGTTLKAVAQINRFDFTNSLDSEHYLLQLSVKM